MQTLYIAADHAGYEFKQKMIDRASEANVIFIDLGTHNCDSVDYPDFSRAVCERIIEDLRKGKQSLGVLVCGSGVGVSIGANRYQEIRAVLAESPIVAKLSREHNHSNVLCLGSRIISVDQGMEILKAYLSAVPDQGERHVRRIEKLSHMGNCS